MDAVPLADPAPAPDASCTRETCGGTAKWPGFTHLDSDPDSPWAFVGEVKALAPPSLPQDLP